MFVVTTIVVFVSTCGEVFLLNMNYLTVSVTSTEVQLNGVISEVLVN